MGDPGRRIPPVGATSFRAEAITERGHLQDLLKRQIEVLDPNLYVLGEEFSDWDESLRRIDLLCVDRDANLVVVELKRDEDSGHAELQALRYAAMVSALTFQQAVRFHQRYLGDGVPAESKLLEFLGWAEPQEDDFGRDVRIVLASHDFSKEVTSTVLWLRDRGLDIRCFKMVPLRLPDGEGHRILVDVQQLIPVPGTNELMMRIAEKSQKTREAVRVSARDYRRFDVTVYGEHAPRLAKNRAALRVVKGVIEHCGISPADLLEIGARHAADWYAPILVGFEGHLESGQVFERLAEVAPSYPQRFFHKSDELIYVDDETWVFTTQWGGAGVEALIGEIKALVGDAITYSVSPD